MVTLHFKITDCFASCPKFDCFSSETESSPKLRFGPKLEKTGGHSFLSNSKEVKWLRIASQRCLNYLLNLFQTKFFGGHNNLASFFFFFRSVLICTLRHHIRLTHAYTRPLEDGSWLYYVIWTQKCCSVLLYWWYLFKKFWKFLNSKQVLNRKRSLLELSTDLLPIGINYFNYIKMTLKYIDVQN